MQRRHPVSQPTALPAAPLYRALSAVFAICDQVGVTIQVRPSRESIQADIAYAAELTRERIVAVPL